MTDGCFVALLRDVVCVRKPRVVLSSTGSPQTPVYALEAEDVPCCLQPAGSKTRDTLIGEIEGATHVAYLEPLDVSVGDLVVERVLADVLTEPVSAGDVSLAVAVPEGFSRGDRLEIGDGVDSELGMAGTVSEDGIALCEPLTAGHDEDEGVYSVAAYEVVGVRDEAGCGHHLRADLKLLRS